MNVRDWVSRGEEGEEGEGYRAQCAKKHIICQYLKLFTKVNSLFPHQSYHQHLHHHQQLDLVSRQGRAGELIMSAAKKPFSSSLSSKLSPTSTSSSASGSEVADKGEQVNSLPEHLFPRRGKKNTPAHTALENDPLRILKIGL